MEWITVSVIAGYLVGVTLVGSLLARKSKGSSQWAVAGGGMGMMMIAFGIAGTRIGGVGTYGVAGDVITEGVWNFWYGINTFLALALVGLFFAIPYRRLRLQTVSEIFWKRFGSRRCQVFTSLCVQTEYLIVNILEPFVIGRILSGVTGMPFSVGVFIGSGVLILYTSLGGLWGSAVTNIIHCTVILVGLALVGWIGMDHLGGWDGVTAGVSEALATATPPVNEATWWSWVGLGWGAIFAMFFSATIHTPAASIYVNFSSAAKSEKQIVPAFLLAGVIASVMPFLAGWIGIETLAKYGSEAQLSSYNLITKLASELNPWIGGVALAAVLAAVISSGGPILLASSTMLVQDWLPFARRLSSERKLLAFRITTVLYGLLAAIIAWKGEISSILDLLLLGFAAVVPPAIAVGYLIYWKRTTEAACFWGMVSGYGVGLSWYALLGWAESVGFEAGEGAGFLRETVHTLLVSPPSFLGAEGEGVDPSILTTLIPLIVIPVISLLGSKARDDAETRQTFYDVLAGKKVQVAVE